MFNWRFLVCVAAFASQLACSQNNNPPEFTQSPIPLPDVEACKKADFKFYDFTPGSARSLIRCLSGARHVLQPYEDFLNQMADSDLQTLLDVYNKFIFGKNGLRTKKLLTLLDKHRSMGGLNRFYKNLNVVTKHRVIQESLPIIGRIVGVPDVSEIEKNRTATRAMRAYLVEIIRQNQLSQLIDLGDRTLNSDRAHALAWLVSAQNRVSKSLLNSDQIVDRSMDIFFEGHDDLSNHALLTGLSDLGVLNLLKKMSPEEMSSFIRLLEFLPQGSIENGSNRLGQFAQLVDLSDRPLDCFSGLRQIPNLFNMMLAENQSRLGGSPQDLYLETLPVLMGLTQESCQYPAGMTQAKLALYETAQAGLSSELSLVLENLRRSQRQSVLKRTLKSPLLGKSAPLLEEAANHFTVGIVMEMLRDLGDQDLVLASRLLRQFTTSNLAGQELKSWAAKYKLNVPKEAPNLWAWEDGLRAKDERTYSLLKWAQMDRLQKGSVETHTREFWARILKESRAEFKSLARALLESFADSEGGLGEFLNLANQLVSYSSEMPLQDAIAEVLSDEKFLDRLSPVLWRLSNNQEFKKAVDFTGTLAGDGRLDIIVQFFQQALKSVNDTPVEIKIGGTVPDSNPHPAWAVEKALQTRIATATSTASNPCLNLENAWTGAGLKQALLCGESLGRSVLSRVRETLEVTGSMEMMAQFALRFVNSGPEVSATLDQVERLRRSGDMRKIEDLLVSAARSPWEITNRVDWLVGGLAQRPVSDNLVRHFSQTLKETNLSESILVTLDVLEKQPQLKFQAKADVRLTAQDEWKATLPPETIEDFETHNANWMHKDGVLPEMSVSDRVQNLSWVVRRFLYSGEFVEGICKDESCKRAPGIEEFLKAFKELGTYIGDPRNSQKDMLNFLKWGVRQQRADKWYVGLSDEPSPRLQTALDQLDLQLVTANVPVPMNPNAGIKFKLVVLENENQVKAMGKVKFQLKMAGKLENVLSHIKPGADSREKAQRTLNSIRNMYENFWILEALAQTGYMSVAKRLFQAAWNSTPERYREVQDPRFNDLAIVDRLAQMGVFSNLSLSVAHLESESCEVAPGQKMSCLDAAVKSFFKLVSLLNDSQVAQLRQILENLDNQGLLEETISKILNVLENPVAYQNIKDNLFHVLLASGRWISDLAPISDILLDLSKNPADFRKALDLGLQVLSADDGLARKIVLNSLDLNQNQIKNFKKLATPYVDDRPILLDLTHFYLDHTADFDDLQARVRSFLDDSETKRQQPWSLMRDLVTRESGKKGLVTLIQQNLENSDARKEFLSLARALSSRGTLADLNQFIVGEIQSGSLDRGLDLIFKYLKSVPPKDN